MREQAVNQLGIAIAVFDARDVRRTYVLIEMGARMSELQQQLEDVLSASPAEKSRYFSNQIASIGHRYRRITAHGLGIAESVRYIVTGRLSLSMQGARAI